MARKDTEEEWFWQIGAELQRLSDKVMQGLVTTASVSRRHWRPNVDMCEREDALEITAELAGVDPSDIHVHFSPERHALIIRGRRRTEGGKSTKRCFQLEVLYGEFEREIALPDIPLDRDGILARFSNGMLIITVPKREGRPQRRTIRVTEE
ncbi:MAG: Hsp20/alpha crystallin family protein [Armatimonadetes bacterium]|nr:Hsp20/alpha crystallin family protein [Armatimonadota bacterium]